MAPALLSAILIAKDEEANLPRCLASLRGAADEVVVVDTGSSDRTAEVARASGARLGYFPWNGDESDARNESLRLASARWVLWIDADEAVSPGLARELREALAGPGGTTAGYASLIWRNHYADGSTSVQRLPRAFRRVPGLRFSGAIHPTPNASRPEIQLAGALEHFGYAWDDALRRRKGEHLLAHLAPYMAADRPELRRFSEHLTALLIAGRTGEFRAMWAAREAYDARERFQGPQRDYWLLGLSNYLLHFALADDFQAARAEAEAATRAMPGHPAARFYLMQGDVKRRDWPSVRDAARWWSEGVLEVAHPSFLVSPETQVAPARAWAWLARRALGEDAPEPLELASAAAVPSALSAMADLGHPGPGGWSGPVRKAAAAALRTGPGPFAPPWLERVAADGPTDSVDRLVSNLLLAASDGAAGRHGEAARRMGEALAAHRALGWLRLAAGGVADGHPLRLGALAETLLHAM